jgi:thiol-disulfide isomerase/thioredoxin
MNKLIALAVVGMVAFFILGENPDMPHETLKVHNQDEFSSVSGKLGGRCATKKCLTIYVAPWCPACKQLKPTIISLKNQLEIEGMEVKVIVGNDSQKATEKYASDYPFATLLDANGKFFKKTKMKGVPFFLVSNSKGKVISEMTGGSTNIITMRKKLDL